MILWIFSCWLYQLLRTADLNDVLCMWSIPLQERPRHLQHQTCGLSVKAPLPCSNRQQIAQRVLSPCTAEMWTTARCERIPKPKCPPVYEQWAPMPAPTVSEDEDGAELIFPDSGAGASVGDNWVLPARRLTSVTWRACGSLTQQCLWYHAFCLMIFVLISFTEFLISKIAGVWDHT